MPIFDVQSFELKNCFVYFSQIGFFIRRETQLGEKDATADTGHILQHSSFANDLDLQSRRLELEGIVENEIQSVSFFLVEFYFYFDCLPSLAGILTFRPPGLGSYSMLVTASYSYVGPLVWLSSR